MFHYVRVSLTAALLIAILCVLCFVSFFFFQAEDGIRDLVRSRGLGDVYKRQLRDRIAVLRATADEQGITEFSCLQDAGQLLFPHTCLLYTSDAADDLLCVDLGGRRIIKKKKKTDTK